MKGYGTYIHSYAGVIFLCSLLFLHREDAVSVWAYHGCSVLKIVGHFVVEGIGIGLFCDNLNVHSRFCVLDNGAQIHFNRVFPFRAL